MRITLLGTGSPIPDPHRAGASTLVSADGLHLLVDCGRGVLMRLMAAGVLPPMLDPSTSIGLQILNAEVTRQGAMVGYDNVFGWMAVGALLMLPMVLIMKSPPPQKADDEVVPD